MTAAANSVFVFKVALKYQKQIWRKIAIRGDQSLATLHDAIFAAFDRDDDHLYSFYFSSKPASTSRNRLDGALRYGCPFSEADDRADITCIESLPLKLKGRFEYLFDYGDEWWHEITLEEIQPGQSETRYPLIVEARGDSPAQYPSDEGDQEMPTPSFHRVCAKHDHGVTH